MCGGIARGFVCVLSLGAIRQSGDWRSQVRQRQRRKDFGRRAHKGNGKVKGARLKRKSRRPLQRQLQTDDYGCPVPKDGTGRYKFKSNFRGDVSCAETLARGWLLGLVFLDNGEVGGDLQVNDQLELVFYLEEAGGYHGG
jgi:hypothetical protein